ncbi:PilZ domain-containing protein [Myxococcota bacterium]|nr:PilZ domain-containing protein [Myxococcota bacterium]MBU1432680.1 PilZ domain-containing protein [Myxococcota bacterium]MBU1898305.1 PilZ domain-containing protein [Myxococcota bacterium]
MRPSVEESLSVGAVTLMHLGALQGRRFKSVIRGWHRDHYISLDRPKAPNGTYVMLQQGQSCAFQFLLDGQACAFNAVVQGWDNREQNPLLRVSWPVEITHVSVRRHQRVEVDLPCALRLKRGSARPARLTDLSHGGCGLRLQGAVEKGEVLFLDVSRPDLDITGLKISVKNVRNVGMETILGCAFLPDQPIALSEISFFISSSLERLRAEPLSQRRVLIMDDQGGTSGQLQALLEGLSLDPLIASSVVDGFHRLRIWSPSVVLLRDQRADIAGAQLCALIHATPGLEGLPLILFGSAALERPYPHLLGFFPDLNRHTFPALIQMVLRICGIAAQSAAPGTGSDAPV